MDIRFVVRCVDAGGHAVWPPLRPEGFVIGSPGWIALSETIAHLEQSRAADSIVWKGKYAQLSRGKRLPSFAGFRLVATGPVADALHAVPGVEMVGDTLVVDFGTVPVVDAPTAGDMRSARVPADGIPGPLVSAPVPAAGPVASAPAPDFVDTGAATGAPVPRGRQAATPPDSLAAALVILSAKDAELTARDVELKARDAELKAKEVEIDTTKTVLLVKEGELSSLKALQAAKRPTSDVLAAIGGSVGSAARQIAEQDHPFNLGQVTIRLKGSVSDAGQMLVMAEGAPASTLSEIELSLQPTGAAVSTAVGPRVPALLGMTESAAMAALAAVGLRHRRSTALIDPHRRSHHGRAIDQIPQPGVTADQGAEVLVVYGFLEARQ
jgi:hypothetical protein